MSKNFCCVTWKSLSKELNVAKCKEIQVLIEKGIPESVFSAILEVLGDMDHHCPVCGYDLINNMEPKPFQYTAKHNHTVNVPPPTPTPPPAKVICPGCKGKGNKGMDENGIDIICARCNGEKELNSSNGWVLPGSPRACEDIIDRNNDLAEQIRKENRPIPKENTVEGVLGQ